MKITPKIILTRSCFFVLLLTTVLLFPFAIVVDTLHFITNNMVSKLGAGYKKLKIYEQEVLGEENKRTGSKEQ